MGSSVYYFVPSVRQIVSNLSRWRKVMIELSLWFYVRFPVFFNRRQSFVLRHLASLKYFRGWCE